MTGISEANNTVSVNMTIEESEKIISILEQNKNEIIKELVSKLQFGIAWSKPCRY